MVHGSVCSFNVFLVCFCSTSFLTSRRLLQFSSPAQSAAGGTSEEPSNSPSPRATASRCSSNIPSPEGTSMHPGIQTWSQDPDTNSSRPAALSSAPSPSSLQDNTSQDTQSSGELCKKGFWRSLKWKQVKLWVPFYKYKSWNFCIFLILQLKIATLLSLLMNKRVKDKTAQG